MRLPTTITCLLLPVALLAGCSSLERLVRSTERGVTTNTDKLSHRRLRDDPLEFVVAGPIGVDVQSFGGNVTVRAVEDLDRAIVTLTRRAVHGFGRTDEAKASLAQITTDVQIVPSSLGQQLAVRTSTTHDEPHFQRVDIDIAAPEIDGVRIVTTNGHLTVDGVMGEIDLTTNDGDVRVMTPQPLRRPVSITNIAGSIDVRVRGESTGQIDCRAVRGRVVQRTREGSMVIHGGTRHDRLLATLNGGGNPITLRTVDGDIRLMIVAAPMQVGQFIVD